MFLCDICICNDCKWRDINCGCIKKYPIDVNSRIANSKLCRYDDEKQIEKCDNYEIALMPMCLHAMLKMPYYGYYHCSISGKECLFAFPNLDLCELDN